MKLVTLQSAKLKSYTKDPQMLHSAHRPCALIVRLKYRGNRYDFAVPMRSNISPGVAKSEYFSLPPRRTTKPHHRHGLHYTKMFPVDLSWTQPFFTAGNVYAAMIKGILDTNEKRIVQECQQYLNDYAAGIKPNFSTDLDYLISLLPPRGKKHGNT